MLEPEVLPQLSYQLFSNEDYQLLDKAIEPKDISILGEDDAQIEPSLIEDGSEVPIASTEGKR